MSARIMAIVAGCLLVACVCSLVACAGSGAGGSGGETGADLENQDGLPDGSVGGDALPDGSVLADSGDSGENGDGAGAADGLDGAGTADGADGTGTPDGLDGTGTPDGLDGTETPDGLDGTGTPDGSDGTGTPDGTDGTGTPDGLDGAGTADGTDGTGTPDGLDGTGTPDGLDGWVDDQDEQQDGQDGWLDGGNPGDVQEEIGSGLAAMLCTPCNSDEECFDSGLDAGQHCVSFGEAGGFCGLACGDDAGCPEEYVCSEVPLAQGGSAKQCVPSEGTVCTCGEYAIEVSAWTNCLAVYEFGSCPGTRACSATGLSECDGAEAEAEKCDGLDNNCNSQVDEGYPDCDKDKQANCTDKDDDNDGALDVDDCAPCDPERQPGAAEPCDGIDNDCDFEVDEGSGSTTCGVGPCQHTVENCKDGQVQVCDPQEGAGVEVCDGVDNNCNGATDEEFGDLDGDGEADCVDTDDDDDSLDDEEDNCPLVPNPLQADVDDDGIGDACDGDKDGDGVADAEDNCPEDPNEEQADFDDDLAGDACDPDDDGDGDPDATDCAKLDPQIHAGAIDPCDGIDNNCSGEADEVFPDTDQDGVADCMDPDDDGDADPDESDCAPLDAAIHSGAVEACDGTDNDCDWTVDEELGATTCGIGECVHTIANCEGGQVLVCDPMQGAEEETCDGLDTDCDGEVDEDLGGTTCGLGECVHTVDNCAGGQVQVCDPMQGAEEEICDGLDTDCDGEVDEGLGATTCGLGECIHTIANCEGGQVQDCDPVQGAEAEVCDGLDEDCNGLVDDGFGETTCGLGACEHTIDNCDDGQLQDCDPMEGAADDVCDGIDNDCDGETDEELGTTTCGQGVCQHTVDNCVGGQVQECDPMQGSTSEACDGLDNDCDGSGDEELGTTTCGLGACNHTVENCVGGAPQVCDPLQGAVAETCDGADNDCNGAVPGNEADGDGDGVRVCGGDCNDGNAGIKPGATETCGNAVDENCNGQYSEGCGSTFLDCGGPGAFDVGQNLGCDFSGNRYIHRLRISCGCNDGEWGGYTISFSDGSSVNMDATCGSEMEISGRFASSANIHMNWGGGGDNHISWTCCGSSGWGIYYK